jgi:hypothetical protein
MTGPDGHDKASDFANRNLQNRRRSRLQQFGSATLSLKSFLSQVAFLFLRLPWYRTPRDAWVASCIGFAAKMSYGARNRPCDADDFERVIVEFPTHRAVPVVDPSG